MTLQTTDMTHDGMELRLAARGRTRQRIALGPIMLATAVLLAVCATASAGQIRIWPLPQDQDAATETPAPIATIPDHYTVDLEFSPDGESLLVVTQTSVELWDIKSTRRRLLFSGRGARFSPDGRRIAVRGSNHVEVVDAGTGSRIFEKLTSEFKATAFAFTADGNHLLVGGDGRVHVWDAETGNEIGFDELK